MQSNVDTAYIVQQTSCIIDRRKSIICLDDGVRVTWRRRRLLTCIEHRENSSPKSASLHHRVRHVVCRYWAFVCVPKAAYVRSVSCRWFIWMNHPLIVRCIYTHRPAYLSRESPRRGSEPFPYTEIFSTGRNTSSPTHTYNIGVKWVHTPCKSPSVLVSMHVTFMQCFHIFLERCGCNQLWLANAIFSHEDIYKMM